MDLNGVRESPTYMNVLLVEDEPATARALMSFLHRCTPWKVRHVVDSLAALSSYDTAVFSVALVDWNLPTPGPDGLQLCRILRQRSLSLGIILVTGRDEAGDRLVAIEAGVDDHLIKPFNPLELVMKVRSVGRRAIALDSAERLSRVPTATADAPACLSYGPITVDLAKQLVTVASGEPIDLPRAQFRILVALVGAPNRIVTHDQLRHVALRAHGLVDSSTIRNHVHELRSHLGEAGALIRSARGAGYVLGGATVFGRLLRKTAGSEQLGQVARVASVMKK